MGDVRPYLVMELSSPGVRPPLEHGRVMGTAKALDVARDEAAALRARVAELEARPVYTEERIQEAVEWSWATWWPQEDGEGTWVGQGKAIMARLKGAK